MKYYIIAGEASGDLHGANLMKYLKEKDPDASFRFWGGDKMNAQGGSLVKHINNLAFMGFWEVLINLKKILKNISFCKADILKWNPDAVILIDYPGFNLRIAEHAKKHGIKVIYYISPQLWAWKQSRIKKIKRYVDKMLVILPFEKNFYKKFNYEVDFVGHPLIDALENEKKKFTNTENFLAKNHLTSKPVIAILPGSRKQEISKMLKIMSQVVSYFPGYQFLIAGISSYSPSFYEKFTKNSNVNIVYDQTYQLLQSSSAAIVASGTATLETALFNIPQVVCYKAGKISYFIARKLVNVKYISLVNLIMDKMIVKELIQKEFNPDSLKKELTKLLNETQYRNNVLEGYIALKNKLGSTGASEKASQIIYNYLAEV